MDLTNTLHPGDVLEDEATDDDFGFDLFDGSGWTPPPTSPPPAAPSFPPPAMSHPPRHRGRRLFVAAVSAATLVGAASGYVAGSLAGDDTTDPVTATTTATAVTAPVVATSATTTSAVMNVAAVVAQVQPSVVTITTQVTVQQGPRSYTGTAAGTGIILTSDGQVLTNAHVVADATSTTVTLAGETTARTATLIGADTANDVALLQIVGVSGLTPATIGDADQVAVGDDVVAIGNALDLEGDVSVTRGIISALHRSVDVDSRTLTGMLQTDTAISSGNSGGPLVNADGAVIGMITAGATSSGSVTAENIGFAITIDHAMEVVASLRAAA